MAIPLQVLHQDDVLVAIDKPSGMVVHRSELVNDRHTCMTLLRDQLGRRVSPVHRLDRGTSGVLLFAFDATGARVLTQALAQPATRKLYLAAVRGWPAEEGLIDRPLDVEGKVVEAATRYRRLAASELPVATGPRHATSRFALLEVELLTGRLHQIRRHLQGENWPVLGDNGHGDVRQNRRLRELFGVGRMLLHARTVRFAHPGGGVLELTAPLPADMQRPLEALGLG